MPSARAWAWMGVLLLVVTASAAHAQTFDELRSSDEHFVGEAEGYKPGRISLRELRDRTLLLVAFSSGGRRRSELGRLRIENIFKLKGGKGYGIALGRTKTTAMADGSYIVIAGRTRDYLRAWLKALKDRGADAKEGPLFRGIDRWDRLLEGGISGDSVNRIVKRLGVSRSDDAQAVLH